jgi:hypothetical protein
MLQVVAAEAVTGEDVSPPRSSSRRPSGETCGGGSDGPEQDQDQQDLGAGLTVVHGIDVGGALDYEGCDGGQFLCESGEGVWLPQLRRVGAMLQAGGNELATAESTLAQLLGELGSAAKGSKLKLTAAAGGRRGMGAAGIGVGGGGVGGAVADGGGYARRRWRAECLAGLGYCRRQAALQLQLPAGTRAAEGGDGGGEGGGV